MTRQYILEGTYSIAKFMGVAIKPDIDNVDRFVTDESVYYNPVTDWNILMPILDKLESIGCMVFQSFSLIYTCRIWTSLGKYSGSVTITEGTNGGDTPSQATFKAIVEFLKVYPKTI